MKPLALTFFAIALLFAIFGLVADQAAFLSALTFGLLALIFYCIAQSAATRREMRRLAALENIATTRAAYPRHTIHLP